LAAGLVFGSLIEVIDIQNNCLIRRINVSARQIGFMSTSNNRRLVVLTTAGTLQFYDDNYNLITTVNSGGGGTDGRLIILPNDNALVYFGSTVQIYGARTKTLISTLTTSDNIFILARESDNFYHFCTSSDRTRIVNYDATTNTVWNNYTLTNPCTAIQMITAINEILYGSQNSIVIYSPFNNVKVDEITGFTGEPTFIGGLTNGQIAFHAAGRIYVATLSPPTLNTNWSPYPTGTLTGLQTNTNGDFIVTSDANQRELKVWQSDGTNTLTFTAFQQFSQFILVNLFK
jgi:hypothetical protein